MIITSHDNNLQFTSLYHLQGPAAMFTTSTNCSSSIQAVHLASQGILLTSYDMGRGDTLNVSLITKTGQLEIAGPNVKCWVDTVIEGCETTKLLRPLQKALGDGNNFYGILEATTINQDGHSNYDFITPHSIPQASKLFQAWKLTEMTQIDCFEAHGNDPRFIIQCCNEVFSNADNFFLESLNHQLSSSTFEPNLVSQCMSLHKHIFTLFPAISTKKHCNLSCTEQYAVLSSAQQRMVLMQQATPQSTAYIETIACYTKNYVDAPQIFANLVKCHPILATTIEKSDDIQNFVMITNPEHLIFGPEIEFCDSFEAAVEYLTNTIPEMQIASSPLVKFRQLRVGDFTILAVHVHHVITDEVTWTNISNTLQSLMKSIDVSSDQSYVELVDVERSYLNSKQPDIDSNYWKKEFSTISPDVSLSLLPKAESTWNDSTTHRAKHVSKIIPSNTLKEVAKWCNILEITEFQYYLACTSLVLQRYLGVNEITLAIPVSTRTDIHQNTDGSFVNTVLFKVKVDLNKTLKEYVKAVANSWTETLAHSQYPLDRVVKTIWKEHGKSIHSFCCVMFNYYTSKTKPSCELKVHAKHAKMPLILDVSHYGNTIEVVCEWSAGLLDDNIIGRLFDGVIRLYDVALNVENDKLCDIDVLSPLEHKLLQSFCHAESSHQKTFTPIHKTFKEYSTMFPHSIAIVFNDVTLTYRQLDNISSQIATELHQRITDSNVLKRNPVVIAMKKDEYAIASILGIWKAGGHFLPVPMSTLCTVLDDIFNKCIPAAVLHNTPLNTEVIQTITRHNCPLLNVTNLVKELDTIQVQQDNIANLDVAAADDDLAYIIRTSGSTGTPKQCRVSHKSLRIIANAWKDAYKMDTFHVNVLQWAPLTFDVFIGDLVRSLICSPGQMTICPDEFRLDVAHIINLIKEWNIAIAEVTPQFGLQLVENACGNELESLKLLILGSDVLHSHIYDKVKNSLKEGQRLINSYGMTEATIDSAFFEGNTIPRTRTGTVPIGRPLPGVAMHILDFRTLQSCPVGTIGELYISGQVLASGDVNIVQLSTINCKGLKTGDAACWLPSGDIELFGRLDSMVKIRGFRVSTTEIESKIVQFVTGVKDACVVPLTFSESPGHNEFLCAFVTLKDSTDKSIVNRPAMCNQLKGKVPYYMVPDVIHILNKLPLTPHGKVDYKALPNLSQMLREQPSSVETESQIQLMLKELFSEALGVSDSSWINHELTFIEQGGHSLVLIHFCSLIKQKVNCNLGIADVLSYPSIKALASYVEKKTIKTEDHAYKDSENETEISRLSW